MSCVFCGMPGFPCLCDRDSMLVEITVESDFGATIYTVPAIKLGDADHVIRTAAQNIMGQADDDVAGILARRCGASDETLIEALTEAARGLAYRMEMVA